MLAALRLGPDAAYTVTIADEIGRRTGRSVRRVNVFTTLQWLEAKGLVSARLGDPRLALWQNHIERILAEWVGELEAPIYREREVTGFAQDDTGVDVALSDGRSLRAEYLVGCNGGRNLIRRSAGIEFPGWDPTTSWLIAEVETAEEPKWGFQQDALGIHAIAKVENGGSARIVLTEPQLRLDSEPTLRDLSDALIAVYGTDYGIHSPTWISRFADTTRQAAAYRERRVLLAGDAAHVHPPVGGQGLNIGVQDAVNSARWICGLGGRPDPTGARRRADQLVRTACCGVAHRLPRPTRERVPWVRPSATALTRCESRRGRARALP